MKPMFNDNRINISFGDSVTDRDVKITHNGKHVNGVTRIEINVKTNSLIETKLTLSDVVMDNLQSVVTVYMIDYSDGKLKRVKNIEFEDVNI